MYYYYASINSVNSFNPFVYSFVIHIGMGIYIHIRKIWKTCAISIYSYIHLCMTPGERNEGNHTAGIVVVVIVVMLAVNNNPRTDRGEWRRVEK